MGKEVLEFKLPMPISFLAAYVDGKVGHDVFRMIVAILSSEVVGHITEQFLQKRFELETYQKSIRLLLQARVVRRLDEDMNEDPSCDPHFVIQKISKWNVDLLLSGEPLPFPNPISEPSEYQKWRHQKYDEERRIKKEASAAKRQLKSDPSNTHPA
jgi:hypothetical protein